MKEKQLLTIEQVAEWLQIKARSIRNQTGPKAPTKFPIRYVRIGKLIRFRSEDVQAYIDNCSNEHTSGI